MIEQAWRVVPIEYLKCTIYPRPRRHQDPLQNAVSRLEPLKLEDVNRLNCGNRHLLNWRRVERYRNS